MSRDTTDVVERAPSLDRDGHPAYRVETDGRDLTVAIADGVAAVADCDPTGAEFVLYDAVDPDALRRLFGASRTGSERTDGRVVFELQGCRVEVHAGGDLVVYAPDSGRRDGTATPADSA